MQHPGLIIGAINPTGLPNKSASLSELPAARQSIWGISESHLTRPGLAKFNKELTFRKLNLQYHPGAPAPMRSQVCSATGGKQVGTGFLSSMPSKPLQPTWPTKVWDEARFTMNTFYCEGQWIHGAVIYGYASGYDAAQVRQSTDDLLGWATERIFRQLQGKRFITGDFNQVDGTLMQPELWKAAGWKEIQQLMQERYGIEPKKTCKGSTIKDFLWISPELAEDFQRVEIIPHIFPDHSVIAAFFRPKTKPEPFYYWRKPKPIEWEDISAALPDQDWKLPQQGDAMTQSIALAKEFENRVDTILEKKGKHLHHSQKGRGTTTTPVQKTAEVKPITRGRHGAATPQFVGQSSTHAKWFRQLRRLESFCQHLSKADPSCAAIVHIDREWRAICRATGFPITNSRSQNNQCNSHSFREWWSQLASRRSDTPAELPQEPPSLRVAKTIYFTFEQEFRAFELILCKTLKQKAVHNRHLDPNRVFKDVKKPPVAPITMLDDSVQVEVVYDDPADCSLTLQKPVHFDPDLPITSCNGPITPIMVTEDKIWVEEADMIPAGSYLRQDKFVGGLDELFQRFAAEWSKRWDRHIAVDDQYWAPIVSFLATSMEEQKPMELTPITPQMWLQTLRKKKAKAAVGPDGWARSDLLAMPLDLTKELLSILHAIENDELTQWPIAWITGFVHSLEKMPSARLVTNYRPITIFSLIYRTWGSIRATQCLKHLVQHAPMTCFGNLPKRSANQLWYSIQMELERSYDDSTPMAGCMMDIIKAFNHLPRVPILQASLILGIPAPVVRAWGKALTCLERRFAIRGSIGPASKSTTGLAEGCAMSVVGMAVCNFIVNEWISRKQPKVCLWSFVDNWEITAPTAPEVHQGFVELQRIVDLLDLELDPQKTLLWATSPECREWLRSHGHSVSMWAKDLGAHIQYSKQSTNEVIVNKIKAFAERWAAFSRSPASYHQKLKAIRSVSWPNTLHGISSVHLGSDHIDSLRTSAMRALKEHGSGTSPAIHLALVEAPNSDPGYFVLKQTVLDCRNNQSFEQTQVRLDSLVDNPRFKPPPGPCSVLLHRLQAVNWYWIKNKGFFDQWQRPINIWQAPIQELLSRLAEAWQVHIAGCASTRKTFKGMSHTSAFLSRARSRPPPNQAAILRRAMNGSFFTSDHEKYIEGTQRDTTCKFCGQQDSVTHRNWECPHLEPARAQCEAQTRALILKQSPAFYNHGWAPYPKKMFEFHRRLLSMPDSRSHFEEPKVIPKVLELFTDGGAWSPQMAITRIAFWGVALAIHDQSHEFHPLAAGVVPGLLQTVARGELCAAISAIRYASNNQAKYRLWIDSAYVVQQCQQCLDQPNWEITPNIPNHDLLSDLQEAFRRAKGLCIGIVKVMSHQDIDNEIDPIVQWALRGNDAADSIASRALGEHPALTQCWTELQAETKAIMELQSTIQSVLISVGTFVLEQNKRRKAIDDPATITADLDLSTPTFVPWDLPEELPPEVRQFSHPEWPEIYQWLQKFQGSLDRPNGPWIVQRWSWFQLYADYRRFHRNGGPWYSPHCKRWLSSSSRPEVGFVAQTRWFSRYIIKLAAKLGKPMAVGVKRPDSYVINFWCNTLAVVVTEKHRQEIDGILGSGKAVCRYPSDLEKIIEW